MQLLCFYWPSSFLECLSVRWQPCQRLLASCLLFPTAPPRQCFGPCHSWPTKSLAQSQAPLQTMGIYSMENLLRHSQTQRWPHKFVAITRQLPSCTPLSVAHKSLFLFPFLFLFSSTLLPPNQNPQNQASWVCPLSRSVFRPPVTWVTPAVQFELIIQAPRLSAAQPVLRCVSVMHTFACKEPPTRFGFLGRPSSPCAESFAPATAADSGLSFLEPTHSAILAIYAHSVHIANKSPASSSVR